MRFRKLTKPLPKTQRKYRKNLILAYCVLIFCQGPISRLVSFTSFTWIPKEQPQKFRKLSEDHQIPEDSQVLLPDPESYLQAAGAGLRIGVLVMFFDVVPSKNRSGYSNLSRHCPRAKSHAPIIVTVDRSSRYELRLHILERYLAPPKSIIQSWN